jgi:hypothetical protein
VAYLREQLQAERQAHAEARRIIAGLVERIPAIEAPSDERESPVGPAAPGKDRTEGGEGTEVGCPSQLEFGAYLRVAAFSLVVLIGLSIGAILVDAALREAPYIDPWAYAAGALCLFPIGFGFAFGYLTVGNLTPRIGASALLVVLPSALLMIVVGAALLGYAGITVVRLLYSIPVRAFDPEVVLIPAGVSLSGAMFFLFSALVGHALHRQGADESGVSAHALTPLQQALIGVLGAFITAVFSFCGVLVQVFFASSGTP